MDEILEQVCWATQYSRNNLISRRITSESYFVFLRDKKSDVVRLNADKFIEILQVLPTLKMGIHSQRYFSDHFAVYLVHRIHRKGYPGDRHKELSRFKISSFLATNFSRIF